MSRPRRPWAQPAAALVSAVLLSAVLAGCGSGGSGDPAATPSASELNGHADGTYSGLGLTRRSRGRSSP